jgi:hypothetical protein
MSRHLQKIHVFAPSASGGFVNAAHKDGAVWPGPEIDHITNLPPELSPNCCRNSDLTTPSNTDNGFHEFSFRLGGQLYLMITVTMTMMRKSASQLL